MIGQAGWWTWTPSTTPLQPKNEVLIFGLCSTSDDQLGWSMDFHMCHLSPGIKWNAYFWITQLLMIGWIVDGLKPYAPSLSNRKNEMLIFLLCSTSDDQLGWSMDSNPIHHSLKWNVHFWIMFNFWWSAGLVDGLEPHAPPFSNQKTDMIIFGLRSSSDDQLGWSMDSNPIHHPSPVK